MNLNGINILKNNDITYLENILLDGKGQLKIVPYNELKDVSQNDISVFCCKYGIYNVPTQELIDFLKDEIKGKLTIEIGAGNGAMAKALNIIATDSLQQANPKYREMYIMAGQTPVSYGDNIKGYDANSAVKFYKPQICIGAWVTHKYNPLEHWREGNEAGIEEEKIVNKVQKYIFIGNSNVHSKKPILSMQYREVKADWLVSRSLSKESNVIWIWEK